MVFLASLSTLHFRNLAPETLGLGRGISLIAGDNGAGKTNLLEAIYLGLTGLTNARRLEHLIKQGEQEAYVRTELQDLSAADFGLSIQEVGIGRGRKQLKLDGVRVGQGQLPKGSAVFIRPEDSQLVFAAPAFRRRFLDALLSRLSAHYALHLSRYERTLLQRNAALKQGDRVAVEAWNAPLAAEGLQILDFRQRAVVRLSELANNANNLLGSHKALTISLVASLAPTSSAESYIKALQVAWPEELARGSTSLGPHRDDLRLLLDGWDASDYASRGEGRSIALALRYAEVELLTERYQTSPVLLLDDVGAELDPRRRDFLLQLAASLPQALVTSTESRSEQLAELVPNYQSYQMRSGRLLA